MPIKRFESDSIRQKKHCLWLIDLKKIDGTLLIQLGRMENEQKIRFPPLILLFYLQTHRSIFVIMKSGNNKTERWSYNYRCTYLVNDFQ